MFTRQDDERIGFEQTDLWLLNAFDNTLGAKYVKTGFPLQLRTQILRCYDQKTLQQ